VAAMALMAVESVPLLFQVPTYLIFHDDVADL
jgi:hypothetical protein